MTRKIQNIIQKIAKETVKSNRIMEIPSKVIFNR